MQRIYLGIAFLSVVGLVFASLIASAKCLAGNVILIVRGLTRINFLRGPA